MCCVFIYICVIYKQILIHIFDVILDLFNKYTYIYKLTYNTTVEYYNPKDLDKPQKPNTMSVYIVYV